MNSRGKRRRGREGEEEMKEERREREGVNENQLGVKQQQDSEETDSEASC